MRKGSEWIFFQDFSKLFALAQENCGSRNINSVLQANGLSVIYLEYFESSCLCKLCKAQRSDGVSMLLGRLKLNVHINPFQRVDIT